MRFALAHIFRPLARLAIAKGMRFAEVSDLLRRAFVDVARDIAGKNATVSNLSILTGLQRRDVSKLLDEEASEDKTQPDPLSRLVALWLAEFDAEPLPQHGAEPSFDALARRIRKDVHPRTLLDRLSEAGTVAVEDGVVQLLKKAYVPLEGSEQQIRYLGENVGDHLAVAVGNVMGDPASFELAVHYDGLSEEAVLELHALWRERMRPVLEEINARALDHQKQGEGSARFRAGGYFRLETKK